MARRVSDYRIRRIAEQGNKKDGHDTRARGDCFYRNRRFADRGNEMVDRDPWDIFEIKRLQKRVRDLEIQHEIKQIRKRIQDLELQRETSKETESRYIVRDDVNEEEEYPSFDSHPRFFEPIYPVFVAEETLRFDEDEEFGYASLPVFDNYGDEEDYVHQESKRLEPRDKGGDGEQPFNGHSFRFYEPIYQQIVLKEKPKFDNDENSLGGVDFVGCAETVLEVTTTFEPIIMGSKEDDKLSDNYGSTLILDISHQRSAPQNMDILPSKVVVDSKLYGHTRLEDITINKGDLSMDENEFRSAGYLNFSKHLEINISGSIWNKQIIREANIKHGSIQKKPQLKKRRHDIPFDPGGSDSKAKFADEFFSKRRRMMHYGLWSLAARSQIFG